MLIFNGENTLDVTPKAYEVIYKDNGYAVQTEAKDAPDAPKAPAKKSAKTKAGE